MVSQMMGNVAIVQKKLKEVQGVVRRAEEGGYEPEAGKASPGADEERRVAADVGARAGRGRIRRRRRDGVEGGGGVTKVCFFPGSRPPSRFADNILGINPAIPPFYKLTPPSPETNPPPPPKQMPPAPRPRRKDDHIRPLPRLRPHREHRVEARTGGHAHAVQCVRAEVCQGVCGAERDVSVGGGG